MNQRSVIPAEAGIQRLLIEMDSRFRGNDGLKKTIRTCGLPSLVVNSIHILHRSENPVLCVVNVRMDRHFAPDEDAIEGGDDTRDAAEYDEGGKPRGPD